jgi:hypothetical protein
MRPASLLSLLLVACPAPRVAVDATTWCADYVKAGVELGVRCGAMTASGGEVLVSRHSGPCETSSQRRFDADAARACLEASKTASCTGVGPEACRRVVVGLAPLGADCFELDCAPGLTCDISATCPGRCVEAPSRVAIGASCAANQACVSDATCVNDVCVANAYHLDAGSSCDPALGVFCGLGLQCVGDGCIPLSAEGESCAPPLQCIGGLRCSPQRVCEAPPPPGAVCDQARQCRDDLFCGTDDPAGEGQCLRKVQLGGLCAPGQHQCSPGLTCVPDDSGFGVCRQSASRGTACQPGAEDTFCALGLYCSASALNPQGTCLDQKVGGAKCTRAFECRSFVCGGDGTCGASCRVPVP